jgi:hypothetical protein
MKKLIYSIVFFVVISCTEELSIDLDKHESKLVVNSIFCPPNNININISKSISILDTDTLNYIDNANIQLFCKGEIVENMVYNARGFYSSSNANFIPGNEYSIIVDAPNFNKVTAKSLVPLPCPMQRLDTITFEDELLYCEFGFNDDPNTSNYYLIEVKSKFPIMRGDSTLSNQVDIMISDVIVENGAFGEVQNRIFFSDEMIQQSVYEISFILNKTKILNSFNNGSNTIYIYFKNISEEYYLYLKSYHASKTKQKEVYSNINNGYGIFASYNLSMDSIEFRN